MGSRALGGEVELARARAELMEHLRQEIKDERVLQAMAQVAREHFVPPPLQPLSYEDRPLPIGKGQTISQPFIVALMLSALELGGQEKVLELGTGSGYQAAILSLLCARVVSVERIPELAVEAEERLSRLGYSKVEVHLSEKGLGWEAAAPYEAILVSAAAPTLPQKLLEQLSVGGRMVVPVGSRYEQDLLRVRLKEARKVSVENLGGCRFVPLIGEGAWGEADLEP